MLELKGLPDLFFAAWPVIFGLDLSRYLIFASGMVAILAIFALPLAERRIQKRLATAKDIRREIGLVDYCVAVFPGRVLRIRREPIWSISNLLGRITSRGPIGPGISCDCFASRRVLLLGTQGDAYSLAVSARSSRAPQVANADTMGCLRVCRARSDCGGGYSPLINFDFADA